PFARPFLPWFPVLALKPRRSGRGYKAALFFLRFVLSLCPLKSYLRSRNVPTLAEAQRNALSFGPSSTFLGVAAHHRWHYLLPLSRLFQRTQASARAFLSASFASGASPARMKPCPAPS